MTRTQFLSYYEKLWEIPPGTLKSENRIDELGDWDSLAVLNTVVLMDRELGIKVTGAQLVECRTLGDILNAGTSRGAPRGTMMGSSGRRAPASTSVPLNGYRAIDPFQGCIPAQSPACVSSSLGSNHKAQVGGLRCGSPSLQQQHDE